MGDELAILISKVLQGILAGFPYTNRQAAENADRTTVSRPPPSPRGVVWEGTVFIGQ